MKKLKTDFFYKLLFSVSTKKLKIDFFEILIIFNNLSKYVKSDFFNEKSDFSGKKILSKRILSVCFEHKNTRSYVLDELMIL